MASLKCAWTVLICSVFISNMGWGQIILQGVVVDETSEPVKYVLVELIDEQNTSRIFSSYTNEVGEYEIETTTSVKDKRPQIPGNMTLNQNYPNPFNPSTVISWEIFNDAHVRVAVHNILGQNVKTLYNGFQTPGINNVIWDATDDFGNGVPTGVYFYSLNTGETHIVKKMLLIDGNQGGENPLRASNKGIKKYNHSVRNKQLSDQYLLRITGNGIETFEKQNLIMTESMVLNVTVTRIDVNVSNAAFETLGIYPGFGGAWPDPAVCEGVENFWSFEDWLGRSMKYVDLNFGDWSWPDFGGSAASIINSENGFVRALPEVTPYYITPLGVRELLMEDGSYFNADNETGVNRRKTMFKQIAAGNHDEHYETIATDLKLRDAGNCVIRLGHEFDIIYTPWSVAGGNHEEYKNAFQHIVTVMRTILPELQFCYNWTGEGNEINPDDPGKTFAESAYPGKNFVDVIGVDVYDANTWSKNLKDLNHARDMAIRHNKPLAIPEWGLWHNHLYPGKPGDEDNPAFIQNMVDYMNSLPKTGGGRLVFNCYFQELPDHDIFTFPKSKEIFFNLFGKSSE